MQLMAQRAGNSELIFFRSNSLTAGVGDRGQGRLTCRASSLRACEGGEWVVQQRFHSTNKPLHFYYWETFRGVSKQFRGLLRPRTVLERQAGSQPSGVYKEETPSNLSRIGHGRTILRIHITVSQQRVVGVVDAPRSWGSRPPHAVRAGKLLRANRTGLGLV
eukprot:1557540-Rhodomonas_salina.3